MGFQLQILFLLLMKLTLESKYHSRLSCGHNEPSGHRTLKSCGFHTLLYFTAKCSSGTGQCVNPELCVRERWTGPDNVV